MNTISGQGLVAFAGRRPRLIAWAMGLSTLILVALAGLPSLSPSGFPYLHGVKVDTDPENMLPADEPVRLFHNAMKDEFSLYDMVVVGIVNETHPDGIFNVQSLARIHELSAFARTLQWPDPAAADGRVGVVKADMLAPSMVDTIEQAGLGAVRFGWLMPAPPETRAEALAVRTRAAKIPLLNGTLVSEDGKAIALYLPLTSKDLSYRVRAALLEKTASWAGTDDRVYVTGLPVAEDTFGVEMFYQMAISAPLAMLVIFGVMWGFFRNVRLILAPMILAMVSAMSTMALLVISGNTIHIMSSMIPIFIMPIAVLDGVHVLSEFFDRYPRTRDRRATLSAVMAELFTPMLFTSLTTAAGFASLALTPIPPVQVFGLFIAAGVMLAWLWTMLFLPAFIMLIPESAFAGFGHGVRGEAGDSSPLSRGLLALGRGVGRHGKLILAATLLTVVVAGYGIGRITINDNPVKWFEPSHSIRVADRVLNGHFGGTYMAYLGLEPGVTQEPLGDYLSGFNERLAEAANRAIADSGEAAAVFDALRVAAGGAVEVVRTRSDFLDRLEASVDTAAAAAPAVQRDAWDGVLSFIDAERQRDEVFKQPEVLRYMAALQTRLNETAIVGKSNSVADIVKTVHRELLLGEGKAFRIPDTANAVGQTLITYQSSHRPQDLWHFVTPDYRKASIWVQLKSGDNKDMSAVLAALDDFVAAHPPPFDLQLRWFGLNYLNVVWQEHMVNGMLEALAGSFVVVLIMMTLLFRSLLWGALSMIPLTVTIGLIYGVIGLIGKNYDMPVAVLSALSLGLAIDYAIHFLARARAAHAHTGSWAAAAPSLFGEPARAISRNAIVLGVGFLPLIAAPLVPYQTVGIFIAAILLTAGMATLLILPALIGLLEGVLFTRRRASARAGDDKGDRV